MALKMRLKRMGKKNLPFYRLVVVDQRWRRDGKTVAEVGWYDPVKQPVEMAFKEKDIYRWLENGVKPSETVLSLLKQQGIWSKFKSGEYKNLTEDQMVTNTTKIVSNEEVKNPGYNAPKPKVEAPVEAAPAAKEAPAEEAPAAEAAPADAPAAEETAAEPEDAPKEESPA
ncbi:MAG: 30S ribosomal protein S16 [Candidatus Hinthialibacter antarcticus]|nr:30S ribosomal protein S16 [Candidatus Hinthialibacter antarcticus]